MGYLSDDIDNFKRVVSMVIANVAEIAPSSEFETLISGIRKDVLEEDVSLANFFDIYAQEARFARFVFDSDLKKLQAGSSILEVGAGMMLLSCQLRSEGFNVTALEPLGDGFSHFMKLQNLVKQYAARHDIEPIYLECGAEEMMSKDEFDYAFSSNVMEHVGDIGEVLVKVSLSLKSDASYRFICPNYAFPYEPHFNMPTLFSKKLTERLMWRRIKGDKKLPDPVGTWRSLNWITPAKVKRISYDRPGIMVCFNSDIFIKYLERALNDPLFQERRGKKLSVFLRYMRSLGVFKLVNVIPIQFLPVMDCTLTKLSDGCGSR